MTTTQTTTRSATIHDIIRRLTGPYQTTAAHPQVLLGGMGDAQHGVMDALDESIDAGFVRVVTTRDTSYGKNIRMVTLADGIAWCRTCHTGCDHGPKADPGSCGHLGCWGPDATSDCPGVGYARANLAHNADCA